MIKIFFSGLSQSNQRNRQTQSPRQMSPRPPLIPSRSRDTNSRSRDSPNMSREQIIGESRSKFQHYFQYFYPNPKIKGIGTSPIQEIHRPIAIRSEPSGLASPLSSLSIGQRVTDQSEVSPPRHLRNDTPLPPPPQNIPSNDHSTSSTALYSSNPVGASSIQAANQQEPPPQPTQRRLTARMTPPLPSITTINSSAQQNSASSTQQIGKTIFSHP